MSHDSERAPSCVRRYPAVALSCALLGPLADAALAAVDREWTAQIGISLAERDNFFFRGDDPDVPAPSATVTTLHANGELELDAGEDEWTFEAQAAASRVDDIDDADYMALELEAEYERGSRQGTVELAYQPNRIYSEEADGVFFDLASLSLEARQDFDRAWLGLEYSVDDWRFPASEADRNALSHELGATYRFPVAGNAGIRAFALLARKDADGADHRWEGYGFGLALEWPVSDALQLFARVRHRERDYRDAPLEDSNFQRSDTILDGLVNVVWELGEVWSLQLAGSLRDGESTRPDRNYTAGEFRAGLFYRF